MATARTKRPLAQRTNEVDRLASKLGSRLRIADVPNNGTRAAKGTRIAQTTKTAKTAEENRAAAMKSINNVLQGLASSTGGKGGLSLSAASSSATAGRAALNILRKLDPALIETERAALCMVGKLLALNAYDAAVGILEDVRKHLPSFYEHQQGSAPSRTPVHLLQLPLPVSSLDASVQSCVQTYLSHSLSVVAHIALTKPDLFDALCLTLDGSARLRSWSVFLTDVPRKSLDGLFKRAYVSLTTSLASPPLQPLQILRIRFHALCILLLSSEVDVTSFWEQCLKYATSYIRNEKCTEGETEKVSVLLECFASVEKGATGRREGKGWIAFCEYWLALAKRAGDKKRLSFVASYIRNAASSSSDLSQLITRTCTTLTQLTVALEQVGLDNGEITSRADAAIGELQELQPSLASGGTIDGKLWRTIEKCRKACIQVLSGFRHEAPEWRSVSRLLVVIVGLLEHSIKVSPATSDKRTDATISVLDSLFQLATAIFSPQSADSCDQAYDYLSKALRLIERCPSDGYDEKRAVANYLRCLSGAFANLAGALYKADRLGFAIRFLTQACPLSLRASICYAESNSGGIKSSQRDREVWLAHNAQVYRRWELLGVCYMKTGDRRPAHEAFLQGVVTYPFEDDLSSGNASKVELPPSLTNAVDRLTHLAVFELRFDPTEVSLCKSLLDRGISPTFIGLILLRQAGSLSDRSRPYVRPAISAILADALEVYNAVCYPVRRAEVFIRVLEHTYYGGDSDAFLDGYDPERIVKETEALLSEKASVGNDAVFTHLRPYLRATVLFWTILHSHRNAKPTAEIAKQAKGALDSLEALVSEPANTRIAKDGNTVRGRKAAPSTRTSSRPAQKTTALPSRSRTARSKSIRRPVVKSVGSDENKSAKEADPSPSSGKHEMGTSEYTILAELALMVAEMFDFSGLTLIKIQLLIHVRRLCDKIGAEKCKGLRTSCMLAHELSKLGKLTLASDILTPIAEEVCQKSVPPCSAAVHLLLRYAEVLALDEHVDKSTSLYEDACRLAEDLPDEESGKGISTVSRIRSRAITLERVAIASSVFAVIQDAKNDPAASLKARLQALRLLNRAADTLARLSTTQKPDNSSDPFAMSDVKDGARDSSTTDKAKTHQPRVQLDGLEWRIANALFETQLGLARAYAFRGSVREAEYFQEQAEELSRVLGSASMMAQSLLQKSDLHMALGSLDNAQIAMEEAKNLAQCENGLHEVDVLRATGDRLLLCSEEEEAKGIFDEATKILKQRQEVSDSMDKRIWKGRKPEVKDAFAPVLQAKILRQQVWLLRDILGKRYEALLEDLFALPQRYYVEVHINSVLSRLALYDIHERFRADMSLSSLAESTIASPMGMNSEKSLFPTPPQDILDAIQQADEHYVSDLSRFSELNSVDNVRSAAVSLALISAYQTSLGIAFEDSPAFMARLLDMSCSITLRRELIETISFKFPNPLDQDDMRWPSESSPVPSRSRVKSRGRGLFDNLSDDDDDERSLNDTKLREYWDYVLKKCRSETFIPTEDSASEIDGLPKHWTVITISLTEDKSALLMSRQRPKTGPMVFCVPLKDRREEDDEGHFTFDSAMTELKDIIKLNDEGARGASQIRSDDKEAKIAWWASRKQLDQRMKDLVENIEFCWLGAFKTVLNQPVCIPPDAISALRTRLEKVFNRILGSQEKKAKKAKLRLESNLLELFAALPPTCRDEELQDLVYFVLDLYHFHGLSVALAEVDIDLVVMDLRTALEEFHSKNRRKLVPEPDSHMFLVLDKNVQGIPWESLPVLRGHSVSRVPSISFIADRLVWARSQRGLPLDPAEGESERLDRVCVDPSKGYYLLNPSGDLAGTEGRFKGWASELKKVGWDGVTGKEPSEQQFLNALSRKDLVVYFGHNGAEQYTRSYKIRHLQRCAATMLWGCSSGALREMGDFDRIGTPNNYMLAGCPSLVANLWDVTDRDIDKFAQSVFTKLRLEAGEVGQWHKKNRDFSDGKLSIVAAVAQSRDVCKLKYLTGAAVVVYGIPYYL